MKFTCESATMEEKRDFVNSLLKAAGSKFITVEFVKKDGSNRVMNIQQANLKYNVKGDEASESAKKAVETRKKNNPNLLAVWDNTKQEVRSINLDTVHTVRFASSEWKFPDVKFPE